METTFDKILILVLLICRFNLSPFLTLCLLFPHTSLFIYLFYFGCQFPPEMLCSPLKNLPFRKSTRYIR